jgi:hypothetical protein
MQKRMPDSSVVSQLKFCGTSTIAILHTFALPLYREAWRSDLGALRMLLVFLGSGRNSAALQAARLSMPSKKRLTLSLRASLFCACVMLFEDKVARASGALFPPFLTLLTRLMGVPTNGASSG